MRYTKKVALLSFLILMLVAGCSSGNTGQSNSDEKTYTMTFAHGGAASNPSHLELEKMGKRIEEKSKGRLSIKFYPNGQLGAQREVTEAVQNGEIGATAIGSALGAGFVPEMAIFDIPFIVDTKELGRYLQRKDSPLFEKLAAFHEEKGFKLMGFYDGGFRNLTTKGVAVSSIDDLKGLKLGVTENPNFIETWKLIGANPSPVPFTEIYTALQQGVVAGQDHTYEFIVNSKYYEVQDYIVNLRSQFTTLEVILNLEFYQKLPEDLQDLVDEEFSQTMGDISKAIEETDDESIKMLKDKGLSITDISDEERQKFKKRTAPVINSIRKQAGDEIVDLYLSEIENFSGK